MKQDTSYPDPAQLRAFADDPMPFDDITASDLELIEGDIIRVGIGNVEYRYRPGSITINTAPGEWEPVDAVDYTDIDHREAWDRAIDLEIQEDFICVTEFDGPKDVPMMFDAYWILDEIRIECNKPDTDPV